MVEPGNRVRVGDGQRGGMEVERMSHCVLSSVFSKAHTSSFLLLSAWLHVISPGKHCSLSALLSFCGAPFPGGPPGSLLPSPSAVTYHLLCGLLQPLYLHVQSPFCLHPHPFSLLYFSAEQLLCDFVSLSVTCTGAQTPGGRVFVCSIPLDSPARVVPST